MEISSDFERVQPYVMETYKELKKVGIFISVTSGLPQTGKSIWKITVFLWL